MRIGLFTTDFPFREPFVQGAPGPGVQAWGGVAEVVFQLARSLSLKGHTVKVFTISPTRDDIVQTDGGITVYRYARDLQVASTLLSSALLWKPLQHELDVAHGHLGTPPGAFAALAYAKARSTPLVVTVHTAYNDVSLRGGSSVRKLSLLMFMNLFCSPLLRSADALTAVSRPVMQESPPFRGFTPRTDIIPNGVDLDSLRADLTGEECRRTLGIAPESKVVLFVGSLSRYKCPEVLLEAFGRLAERDPHAVLVMLGDGPLREELIGSAKAMRVEDKVVLAGFVSEEVKRLYYGAADLFVLPSQGDAFGLVLLEAAAFSLPLVATDTDVFRLLIEDGRNGMLFRPSDAEDLSLKLAALLADGERREKIGRQARLTAEMYDWENILRRYDEVYRSLHAPRKAKRRHRALPESDRGE